MFYPNSLRELRGEYYLAGALKISAFTKFGLWHVDVASDDPGIQKLLNPRIDRRFEQKIDQ